MSTVRKHARPQGATIATPVRPEVYLSGAELATAAEISPARLSRLVRLGLVEPAGTDPDIFTAETAVRLRRMLRLHDDLGVNFIGVAIIVDLLERFERHERREDSWTRTG